MRKNNNKAIKSNTPDFYSLLKIFAKMVLRYFPETLDISRVN